MFYSACPEFLNSQHQFLRTVKGQNPFLKFVRGGFSDTLEQFKFKSKGKVRKCNKWVREKVSFKIEYLKAYVSQEILKWHTLRHSHSADF